MIRRDVLRQRDNRSVKWSLLAAAFALSLGLYAEHGLRADVEEETTATVAEEAVPAAPAPAVIAG
ncbi:MAG TPA: hypothetical protein VFZ69_14685 [Longimicrobiales bacterium]